MREIKCVLKLRKGSKPPWDVKKKADLIFKDGTLFNGETFIRETDSVSTMLFKIDQGFYPDEIIFRFKDPKVTKMLFDGNNYREIEKWSNGKIIVSPVTEITEDNPSGVYLQINNNGEWITAIKGNLIIKKRGKFVVESKKINCCRKINNCYKISSILDQDCLPFQYAQGIKETCDKCDEYEKDNRSK